MQSKINDLTFNVRNSKCEPELAKALALEAIGNRLFVNGWSLRELLIDIANNSSPEYKNSYDIVLVSNGEFNPVAVGVTVKHSGLTMIFVRKKYRRQGIGSMIAMLLKKRNAGMYFSEGIEGSEKFFIKVGGKGKD